MYLEIESKANSQYKELKKIPNQNLKYVFIEGRKLLFEAFNSHLKIKKIYFDKKNKEVFSNILPKNKNHELIYIKNELLAELFTTENKPTKNDLIVAVAEKPEYELNDVFKTNKSIIFLENIQDPGNLGTIIRSALAFSIEGIILSKNSVNPFNTKVIRSSAGAVFKLPVVSLNHDVDFKAIAKREKYKIIAFSPHGSKKLDKVNLSSSRTVFLFGNESMGLSKDLLNISDEVVEIPHSKLVESLNLSVAVSIVLWVSCSTTYK